jgi:hypothetical protein
VLELLVGILWLLRETLVRSKDNVRYVETVYTFLRVNHFVVVKNFESESPWYFPWQVLSVLKKSNIDTHGNIVNDRLNYFFFEDDSIFPRLISIGVLNWLCAYDFIESKGVWFWLHINLNLALRSIIGHHAFYDESVAVIILG